MNEGRARNARSPRVRRALREALERVDPEPIIGCLETFASVERQSRLKEVIAQRLRNVTVVMDAPHDPHNGAAVLRSCDAFGVHTVHVVQRAGQFDASGAVAKGTQRWIDVFNHADPQTAIERIKGEKYTLIGTHPKGCLLPEQLASIERLALVMGNEHDGICGELTDACDAMVQVPMRGFVESLNVSVAAAILLAFATKDRSGDLNHIEQRRLYARGLVLSVPRALDILERASLPLTLTDDDLR